MTASTFRMALPSISTLIGKRGTVVTFRAISSSWPAVSCRRTMSGSSRDRSVTHLPLLFIPGGASSLVLMWMMVESNDKYVRLIVCGACHLRDYTVYHSLSLRYATAHAVSAPLVRNRLRGRLLLVWGTDIGLLRPTIRAPGPWRLDA